MNSYQQLPEFNWLEVKKLLALDYWKDKKGHEPISKLNEFMAKRQSKQNGNKEKEFSLSKEDVDTLQLQCKILCKDDNDVHIQMLYEAIITEDAIILDSLSQLIEKETFAQSSWNVFRQKKKENEVEFYKKILSSKSIDNISRYVNDALRVAIEHNDFNLLQLAIKKGASLSSKYSDNQLSPIEYAASLGRWDCVQLIAKKWPVDASNVEIYRNIKRAAIKSDEISTLKLMEKMGIVLSTQLGEKRETEVAAEFGSLKVIKYFSNSNKVDLFWKGMNGFAIEVAAHYHQWDVVEFLFLKHIQKRNHYEKNLHQDEWFPRLQEYRSIISSIIRYNDNAVPMFDLIRSKEYLKFTNEEIEAAGRFANWKTIEYIYLVGGSLDLLFAFTVASGRKDIVEKFLAIYKFGQKINEWDAKYLKSKLGFTTMLSVAMRYGQLECVVLLQKYETMTQEAKRLLLQYIAENKAADTLKKAIKLKILGPTEWALLISIHSSTVTSNIEMAEVLLANDCQGLISKMVAENKLQVVHNLLLRGSYIPKPGEELNLLYRKAIVLSNVDLIKDLILKGAEFPILVAANLRRWGLIKELIQAGVYDPKAATLECCERLMVYAARENNLDMIEYFKRPELKFNSFGEGGKSVLHYAVENKNYALVCLVAKANPKLLHISNDDKEIPLHKAVELGCSDIVNFLISEDPSLLHVPNKSGDLPITIAAKNHHWEMMMRMFDEPSMRNNNQAKMICLLEAIKFKQKNIYQAILRENKVDPALFNLIYNANGDSVLHCAVSNGSTELVSELIKVGANPSLITKKQNKTPMTLAVDSKSYDIVKCMAENKPCPLNSNADYGDVLSKILEKKWTVQKSVTNNTGEKEIQIQVIKKLNGVAQALIRAGATISDYNYSSSLLHRAIENGDMDIYCFMRMQGLDPVIMTNVKDTKSWKFYEEAEKRVAEIKALNTALPRILDSYVLQTSDMQTEGLPPLPIEVWGSIFPQVNPYFSSAQVDRLNNRLTIITLIRFVKEYVPNFTPAPVQSILSGKSLSFFQSEWGDKSKVPPLVRKVMKMLSNSNYTGSEILAYIEDERMKTIKAGENLDQKMEDLLVAHHLCLRIEKPKVEESEKVKEPTYEAKHQERKNLNI